MIFPTLNTIPENADKFASAEFSPNCTETMGVSIQIKTSLMTDTTSPRISVMGSNISALQTDMVAVKDESLSATAFVPTAAFVKQFFPYKYIGILYTHGSNAGAGTLSVYMEKKVTRVNIA